MIMKTKAEIIDEITILCQKVSRGLVEQESIDKYSDFLIQLTKENEDLGVALTLALINAASWHAQDLIMSSKDMDKVAKSAQVAQILNKERNNLMSHFDETIPPKTY